MTVSAAYTPLTYTGAGSAGPYNVTWPFVSATHLKVTHISSTGVETVKTYPGHYTVTGGADLNGIPGTGSVTMQSGHEPATGTTLRIERVTAKTQSVSLPAGGAFPAKTVEAAVDRLMLIAQENAGGGAASDDVTGDVMTLDSSGSTDFWDAESKIIRNVADPAGSTDAVTRGYYDRGIAALSSVTITSAAGAVLPETYGAVGDGTTDDTTAIQLALDAVGNAGGGTVLLTRPSYKTTNALTMTYSGVCLRGASRKVKIISTGGTFNTLTIGGQASELSDIAVRDLTLDHTGKSGGIGISVVYCSTVLVDDVKINGASNGAYFERTNNVLLHFVNINGAAGGAGAYGLKWYANVGSGHRSDVLCLAHSTIQCSWSGADGFVIDGMCHTPRVIHSNILSTKRGLWVRNTANSGSSYPAHGEFFNVEIDGADLHAVRFDGGNYFQFASCVISNGSGNAGQGNADEQALYIAADTSYSYTRSIDFNGGDIGNCRREAVYCNGRNCTFTDAEISDASKAGVGSYPTMRLGAASDGTTVDGCTIGHTYGESVRASYAIAIDASAQNYTITGNDLINTATGGITDSAAHTGRIVFANSGATDVRTHYLGTDPVIAAASGPLTLSPASGSALIVSADRDVGIGTTSPSSHGANVAIVRTLTTTFSMKLVNQSTGNSAASAFTLSTGIANSYMQLSLQNNSGSPYVVEGSGSAITVKYADYALHTFRTQAGSTLVTIDSGKLSSSVPVELPTYTVAGLPTATVRRLAYASNGRKNGEGAGAGTGVLVFADGTAWRACDTGATVAA